MPLSPESDSLSRLLRPRSIAVLGGSWAQNVVEQCVAMGFDGDIWPIHPQRESVHGIPCFKQLADLPSAPDATFIGVNRFQTLEIVAELAAMDAGGAVCFAAGFNEAAAEDAQGSELQKRLLLAAGTMPIIGPNCYGLINYLDGALLWPDQHGGTRTDRGVAFITQSSNIAINLTMQTRGLPVAYVLTAGNQAQQSIGELACAALHDERVTALGMHIEGFGDLESFEVMAATARKLNKPVAVIKAGRSDEARRGMISHTNSLSGSDAAASAYLRRLGLARLDTLSELLETLKLLHACGPLKGTRLQSMSCSGGEAGLMADAAANSAVTFPPLDQAQTTDLRKALGPLVALANPLDYHTFIWNDLDTMTATFTAMLQRKTDLSLLVLDFPRPDRCDYPDWLVAIEALKQARDVTGATVGILASLPENLPESIAAELLQAGMVPLCGIDDACRAVEAAAFIGTCQEHEPPLKLNHDLALESAPKTLDATESRQWLTLYDLHLPQSVSVSDVDALRECAGTLEYPVVLKGQGIAHKTEVGAVQLNLCDSNELMQAATAMLQRSVQRETAPTVSGFVVESMVNGVVAELLVSIVRDQVHGFVLTLAAGGVMTELLADASQLLLPVTVADIKNALSELKIHAVLQGYRGQPAADIDAIVNSVLQLQQLAMDNRVKLLELEINPLICRVDDAIIVDMLISVDQNTESIQSTGDTKSE